MRNIILQTRIAILFIKEKYNYSTSLKEFQNKLSEYFKEEYSQDEIENALHILEENQLDEIYKEEQEELTLSKEDFKLESIQQLV
jgi:hypothetical protein